VNTVGTLTKVAAWWGASLGTLVFLWDVFKWRHRGALVNVETSIMTMHPPMPGEKDVEYLMATVTNNGAQPTTITHLAGFWYRTRGQRLRRRPEKKFVCNPIPVFGPPPPHVLKPGERWMGGIYAKGAEEYLKSGTLTFGVFHTASKGGIFKVVATDAPSASDAAR
jgi:hypothetical protein